MPTALPEPLDVNELARHLGVNVRHVRRLVAERRIPFIKWGHLLRFDPDEIVDWLEYNRRRIEAGGECHRPRVRFGCPWASPFTRPR